MKELITYLNFDGKAREAMKFYEKILGGKLQLMTFGESQMPGVPPRGQGTDHSLADHQGGTHPHGV